MVVEVKKEVLMNKGFFTSLIDNIKHAAPNLFYGGLGVLVGMPTNQMANGIDNQVDNSQFNEALRMQQMMKTLTIISFVSNTYSRIDQTDKLLTNDYLIAQEHHKIIAESIVNAGVAIAGYTLAKSLPQAAIVPVYAAVATMEVLVHGDNNPIDSAKAIIASGLDSILGNWW